MGTDANALALEPSQTLRLDSQPGLYVRCLSGQVRVAQGDAVHVLPSGTGYRAAPEGELVITSSAKRSLISVVRTEGAALPGVGPVHIDSERALDDGARQLRLTTLLGLLRRRG